MTYQENEPVSQTYKLNIWDGFPTEISNVYVVSVVQFSIKINIKPLSLIPPFSFFTSLYKNSYCKEPIFVQLIYTKEASYFIF